jgi:peptide/nickel transport system ATP-binding protein
MPYTAGLLGAIPRVDGARDGALTAIEGAPPALTELPPGCPFAPRCPLAIDVCRESEPSLEPVAAGGDDARAGAPLAACHRAGELASGALGSPRELFAGAAPPRTPGAAPAAQREVVLEVEDLVRHHPLLKGAVVKKEVGTVRAVDGISFTLRDGETLGLVGESGCGKTSTLMEVLELERPQNGRIVVLGRATGDLSPGERRQLRRELSVVFQDPFASLDPRMPVGDAIAEPLRTHGTGGGAATARVDELLDLVGLEPALARRYPRQLSGGQRQRVAIARAIALEPRVVLLDEPVSALDVSIQAGIINLLSELRDRLGLSLLLVAHDLAIVRHVADRVAVMHLGRIVELGSVDDVFSAPAHPYTRALLAAIPVPDPPAERARERLVLSGEPASSAEEIGGCRFRTRCPLFASLSEAARRPCIEQDPLPEPVGDGREAACHHAARR